MKLFLRALACLVCCTSVLQAADKVAVKGPFDQSQVALEVDAPNDKLAKIVLIAGAPSNKPGQHEYFAGCALMMDWLKQTPGVWPVMVKEWPKDEKIFQGARTIVYFGDGGGKQPFVHPDRWNRFISLVEPGAGLVLLHQAVDFPEGSESKAVSKWLGGVWLKDIGCRGHWDMDLALSAADHPVMRGVKPFAAPADGWLYNLHFQDSIAPLLVGQVPAKSRTTADAKAHAERNEVVAWAYDRPAGGRGFAFTGADLHKSWEYESQRKMVINGILWTAKLDVPAGGALVEFSENDLNRNLDEKTTVATVTKKSK